ncbi:hypothetical protein Tco_0467105 [Tanacetum coccineum]
MLEEKCVLMDDDGKLIEKVDYFDDSNSEDEVKPVDNEMVNFLASKSSGVGYDTKSLLEQYRETYGNAEDVYDPYDGDLYKFLTIFNLYAIIWISRFEFERSNILFDVESIVV